MAAPFETHEVLNQSPPFEDVDLFVLDRPLQDAIAANGAAGEAAALSAFGFAIGPFIYLGHEVVWDRLWPATPAIAPAEGEADRFALKGPKVPVDGGLI